MKKSLLFTFGLLVAHSNPSTVLAAAAETEWEKAVNAEAHKLEMAVGQSFDRLKSIAAAPHPYSATAEVSFKPEAYKLCELVTHETRQSLKIKETGTYELIYMAPQCNWALPADRQFTQPRPKGIPPRWIADVWGNGLFSDCIPRDVKNYMLTIRLYKDQTDTNPQLIERKMQGQNRLSLPMDLAAGNLIQLQVCVTQWSVDLPKCEVFLSPSVAAVAAKAEVRATERRLKALETENQALRCDVNGLTLTCKTQAGQIAVLETRLTALMHAFSQGALSSAGSSRASTATNSPFTVIGSDDAGSPFELVSDSEDGRQTAVPAEESGDE